MNEFVDRVHVRGLDFYPGPGLCFAVVLLLGYALTIRFQSALSLLLVAPYALLWVTLMLATPLSTALRYAFPMLIAIPFLTSLLFAGCSFSDSRPSG